MKLKLFQKNFRRVPPSEKIIKNKIRLFFVKNHFDYINILYTDLKNQSEIKFEVLIGKVILTEKFKRDHGAWRR